MFTAEEVSEMIKSALDAVRAGREDVDEVVAEVMEEETIGDIVVSGR
jgi:hypothetical protein